jgi:AhpD family alkylhydroperoxidase
MSRVRYVLDGPAVGDAGDGTSVADTRTGVESDLIARIRARRGGTLLNLDRLLLNSPPFAQGWNIHLGAVRGGLLLSAKLRELAICAVAVLNGADYEWDQHAPEWLRAGATREQLAALSASGGMLEGDVTVFDAVEKSVLQLTFEMTRNVRVSEPTFERVRRALNNDERQVVELVGVIATYNMVSRFLVALEIDLEKSGS